MSDFRSLTAQSGAVIEIQNSNSTIVGNGIKTSKGDLTITPAGNVVIPSGKTLNVTGLVTSGSVVYSTRTVTSNVILGVLEREVFVDASSSSLTIKLPQTPTVGERHTFKDYKGNFQSNNLIVDGYGNNVEQPDILGTYASTATFLRNGQAVTYEYAPNSTWSIVDKNDGYATTFTTSGLLLWAKNESLTGSTLSTWTDSSGNGNTLTAFGTAPAITANNPLIGNKPSVLFTQGSNYMGTSTITAGNYTMVMLYWLVNGGASYLYAHHESAGKAAHLYANSGSENIYAVGAGGTSQKSVNGINTWYQIHQPRTFAITFDGTNAGHTIRINGVLQTGGTNTQTSNPGSVTRAADLFFMVTDTVTATTAPAGADGVLCEILFYNRALSTGELINVENYLRNKFGHY